MAKKKKKSSTPSGVKIKRNGNKFDISWSGTYASTKVAWRWTKKKGSKWSTASGGTDRKHALNFGGTQNTFKNYNPYTSKRLTTLQFKVKGTKRDTSSINYTESNYSGVKTFTLTPPPVPTGSYTLDDTQEHKGVFNWSLSPNSTNGQHFVNCRWETILVKDCNVTLANGGTLPWKKTTLGWAYGETGSTGQITKAESNSLFQDNVSYTRWVRVCSRGAAGNSAWRYIKHTYASPNKARDVEARATYTQEGGTQINMSWYEDITEARPVDDVVIEYTVAEPTSSGGVPSGSSWKIGAIQAAQVGKNATHFTFDDTLEDDQALFVRVNTEHDKQNEAGITYGDPVSVKIDDSLIGYLKPPTALSVSDVDNVTHRATINANNNSSIDGSFLVVLFRTADEPEKQVVVGIIEEGEQDVTVQAPDWSEASGYAFGVYSAVGSFTEKDKTKSEDTEVISGKTYYEYDGGGYTIVTPAGSENPSEENWYEDSVGIYEVSSWMRSKATIWKGGSVPVAPKRVTVDPTTIAGTVRVGWEWSWKDANSAELSWADHSDAWESTDEPSKYEVANTRAAQWNISGLETGKMWYIRVRLRKATGDTETIGPWSTIETIDLASAPTTPRLELSDSVITEDGQVTASWGYATGDGTAQAMAQITTALYTGNGIRYGRYALTSDITAVEGKEYYSYHDGIYTPITPSGNPQGLYEVVDNIIAEVQTAQHVTINAKDVGWTAGNTYNLCVRVVSASGKASDSWSNPVSVAVAEPLELTINETSLVDMDVPDPDGDTAPTITIGTLPSEVLSFDVNAVMFADRVEDRGSFVVAYTLNEGVAEYTLTGVSGALTQEEIMEYGIMAEYAEGTETASVTFACTNEVIMDKIKALRSMPMTVTTTGAGASGETTIAIERNGSFFIDRPDENEFHGQDGETVYLMTKTGDGQTTLTDDPEFLIGSLDDEARYRLVVTIKDELGQTASKSIDFEVRWLHQAMMPQASVVIDETIAKITPIAPENTQDWTIADGDVADIYRLSVDKPELIYEGATWGQTYVDPYPAIGENGGHRVVFRSVNGDYKTDGGFAWVDLREDEGDRFDSEVSLIDFDGNTIELFYNVDYSSSWQKDFQETKYLGGNVQGDWNPAVSRTGSISTLALTITDQDMIEMMRRLAVWTGVCHVRTRDGSSYAADVQVSEDRSHDDREMITSFSLNITRVDPEGYEGMTLQEWNERQQEEEE